MSEKPDQNPIKPIAFSGVNLEWVELAPEMHRRAVGTLWGLPIYEEDDLPPGEVWVIDGTTGEQWRIA